MTAATVPERRSPSPRQQPAWRFRRPGDRRRTGPPSRAGAIAVAGGALATLAVGAFAYGVHAPTADVVALELAGTPARAAAVVGADRSAVLAALGWDVALVVGYAAALGALCALGRRLFWTSRARAVATAGLAATGAAVVLDLAENVLLWRALAPVDPARWHGSLLLAAAACASLKFVLITGAGLVAVAVLALLVARLASSVHDHELAGPEHLVPPAPCPGEVRPHDLDRTAPDPDADPAGHWASASVVPPGAAPPRSGSAPAAAASARPA